LKKYQFDSVGWAAEQSGPTSYVAMMQQVSAETKLTQIRNPGVAMPNYRC
jgi:hypothetical protein